jgi:hypothetical protein
MCKEKELELERWARIGMKESSMYAEQPGH